MKLSTLSLAVLSSILAAGCGGGGSDSSAPVAHATTAASPTICLEGNSVMRGSYVLPDGTIARSGNAPGIVVGWNFPNHTVRDYSVNGGSVITMRAEPTWPRQGCGVHVFPHYLNDIQHRFAADLNLALDESTAPIKMLVIANVPTPPVRPDWQYMIGNVEIVRSVAAARGVHLCDLNMGSSLNASDGLHLNDTGSAVMGGGIVRCLRALGVQ